MSFIRYLKALRRCAVQCFNANQVTNHRHQWLVNAVEEEQKAWESLPRWARKLIGKYATE